MPSQVIGLIELNGPEAAEIAWEAILNEANRPAGGRYGQVCPTEQIEADEETLRRELEAEFRLVLERVGW